MSTLLSRPKRTKSQPTSGPRADIQGLRTIAVLLVVFDHLLGWPRGGFIGVDVFFVISGFLITGSLLHTLEKTGRISFRSFYSRRIRRIVPAASLVLVVTVIASYFVFSATRFKETTVDALWAFLFGANWRFAIEGTDYFNSDSALSPLQHYWSLSVEEQFYFVWPAVILAIGVITTRRSWSRRARLRLSAATMGVVIAASFIYAVVDTADKPTWAYFSTFTRVWELGVGALLAIGISWLERIPNVLRPVISWAGILMIAVGAFVVTETGGGFPAPWAVLPVVGAALIIGAGVAGEREYIPVLTNRASVYIGDISYSLYLWHWPVIVLLATVIEVDIYFYVGALLLMFALSIGCYHGFENPIRLSNWLTSNAEHSDLKALKKSRWRLPAVKKLDRPAQRIGTAVLALFTAGAVVLAIAPVDAPTAPPFVQPIVAAQLSADGAQQLGPAQRALADEIIAATQVTEWPDLVPSMDDAIAGLQAPAPIAACGQVTRLDAASCSWGDPAAPKSMMVLGNSVAMTYVQLLKNFAEASGGQWKVSTQAMFGCEFIDIAKRDASDSIGAACPGHKEAAIAAVNQARPDVVVISNQFDGAGSIEWTQATERLTSQFTSNVGKIVFLAAPPGDTRIGECYNRINGPADCIGKVTQAWLNRSRAVRSLAAKLEGTYIDSRAWFCTTDGYCPSFVGTTPTKRDSVHMTPEYGAKISPAFTEAMRESGF